MAIGTIGVRRTEVQPFTDKQIELLRTFAAQAVIAIENVRLFNETKEALEQQTATAEILRVISRSPTDVQPVFDVIVQSAVRLCNGLFSGLHPFDGELIHFAAQHNFPPEGLEEVRRTFPVRPTRALGTGRAILRRAVVHIPDVEVDPEYALQALSRAVGFRSGLWVPMMREGAPIGVISVVRAEPGPFSDKQISLLQTFANQAVIAIENVRLFQELQARNRELTAALERETATGGILRAIATSPADPSSVFEAIVESMLRLCGATIGAINLSDGQQVSVAAIRGPAGLLDAVKSAFPRGLTDPGLTTRTIREGVVIHVPDVREEPTSLREVDETSGMRAELYVPMLREGRCIGALVISRDTPGLFSEAQVDPDAHAGGSGRDRRRERPAVPGARGAEPRSNRGARAADGDCGDPAGDHELVDRPPAGHGGGC